MYQQSPVRCKQMQMNGRMMDDITCIIDCGQIQSLYLGNMESATDIKYLEKHKITCILSICMTKIPFSISSQMKHYQHIYLEDNENENIHKYFSSTYDFIERGRQSGNVLVHCMAGISRSAAIVAAYLMKKHQIFARDALKQLERKRWQVYPNDGFVKQLIQYENELFQNIQENNIDWFGKILQKKSETSEQSIKRKISNHEPKQIENEYQKIRKKYIEQSKSSEINKQQQQSQQFSLQKQRKTQFELLNNGIDIQMKKLQIQDHKKSLYNQSDYKSQIFSENEKKKQQLINTINTIGSENPYQQLRLDTAITNNSKKQEFINFNKYFPNTTRNSQQIQQQKYDTYQQNYQTKLDNLLNKFENKNYYQKK